MKPENISGINEENFADTALELFHHQYAHNKLYKAFCDALHTDANKVNTLTEIPFLPISFFRSHRVQTGIWNDAGLLFESSGTTGETTSKHIVKDAGLYTRSLLRGFEQYYGAPEQYAIFALLPSYLERKNASLVYMAKQLMQKSGHADNGFYIDEWQLLHDKLQRLHNDGQKTILLGVTFALLDFAAAYPMALPGTIVMETGGMKGRREEWTRQQVHDFLKKQWSLAYVHSEYGMTELLSQAYSQGEGIYSNTHTMRTLVRDINDPLTVDLSGQGCINIIDLANIHSCAFIATEDIGRVHGDGRFEILGRMDNSALRGCSLMAV